MADRRWPSCLNPGSVAMQLKIPIGASGAVGTVKGMGIVSVVKNTTGVYDVTLDRKYAAVQHFSGSVLRASGATLVPVLVTDYSPSTNLQFTTQIAAGTPTQPSDGDIIFLNAVFDDSNGIL